MAFGLQEKKAFDFVSKPIPVLSGVPQGTVLVPSLFLLFVNDISDIFNSLNVSFIFHADNIKLYSFYDLALTAVTTCVARWRSGRVSDLSRYRV